MTGRLEAAGETPFDPRRRGPAETIAQPGDGLRTPLGAALK